jgi:hypothetical protein
MDSMTRMYKLFLPIMQKYIALEKENKTLMLPPQGAGRRGAMAATASDGLTEGEVTRWCRGGKHGFGVGVADKPHGLGTVCLDEHASQGLHEPTHCDTIVCLVVTVPRNHIITS